MKLDPIFKIVNNKLIFLETDTDAQFSAELSCTVKEFISDSFSALFPAKFLMVHFDQSEIELDDDVYAEDILAALREKLLLCDEAARYVVFVPHTSTPLSTDAEIESFINTCNHTARRVKDCVSVAGFDLTELLKKSPSSADQFTETLAKKHAQYVYFAQSGAAPAESGYAVY